MKESRNVVVLKPKLKSLLEDSGTGSLCTHAKSSNTATEVYEKYFAVAAHKGLTQLPAGRNSVLLLDLFGPPLKIGVTKPLVSWVFIYLAREICLLVNTC